MDPVTIAILAASAAVALLVFYSTWKIFGNVIQILLAFAVVAIIFGLVEHRQATLDEIYAGIAGVVDFAHHVRDIITKP